jgi:hypothetical protein
MIMKVVLIPLGAALAFACSPAYAGCVGVSVGDPCIGIPTPEHEDRVVVEHRHRTPMVVERRRRVPEEFEHNYDHESDGDE